MVKKNNLLNKFEREILRLLDQNLHALSINAIAEKLDISYSTAKKYLYNLLEKELILKIDDGNKKTNKGKKSNSKRKD